MGKKVSHRMVVELLQGRGYSLRDKGKVLAGQADHRDREAQSDFINTQAEKAMDDGNPVLSVDIKKKELIKNYKNAGQTWEPKGNPVKVQDHGFPNKALGKVTPYGIYSLQKDEGWVNVETDHEMGTFAVENLRRWWNMQGQKSYPHCQEIVVTADEGGSNGWRSRRWKQELQTLADEIGQTIRGSSFPPGTSKWNKIEHRLLSHISMNGKEIPLTSHEVVVNLITSTRTCKGLIVHAVLDENKYPKPTIKWMPSTSTETHFMENGTMPFLHVLIHLISITRLIHRL